MPVAGWFRENIFVGTINPVPRATPFLSQCDPGGRNIEWWNWQTPDGVNFKLHNMGTVFTLTEQGGGRPDLELVTERRAFQDGEAIVDAFLKPRVIQLLLRVQCRSRADYWNRRAQLLDMMRPNRVLNAGSGQPPAMGFLTYQLPNTDATGHPIIRTIQAILLKGLDYQPRSGDKWDEWAIQEVLQFTAPNPLFYNPTQKSLTVTTSGGGLVFPITFPITFGGITSDFNLTYNGTWREYPVIQITGPLVNPIITNGTTGESIQLNYTILSGNVVTIDLSDPRKPVTLQDGTSLSKYVASTTDLAQFHLEPNPGAVNGVNVLHVSGTGTASSSSIKILWYERYFGI